MKAPGRSEATASSPEPQRWSTTLVADGGYGETEVLDALVDAAERHADPEGRLVTAREARSAQRVLDALLASAGAWRDVSYA